MTVALRCLWLVVALWLTPVVAADLAQREQPEEITQLLLDAEDAPQRALDASARAIAEAQRRGDPDRELWLWLARTDIAYQAEQLEAGDDAMGHAERLRATMGDIDPLLDLVHEMTRVGAASYIEAPERITERMNRLRPRILATHNEHLLCALAHSDAADRRRVGDLDGAWMAAEAALRCAQGQRGQQGALNVATAHTALARLYLGSSDPEQSRLAQEHMRLALAALGDAPLRFRRAILYWELGSVLLEQGLAQDALQAMTESVMLSLAISDAPGAAIAEIGAAQAEWLLGRPRDALQRLDALASLDQPSADHWRAQLAVVRLGALVELGDRRLAAEVKRWLPLLDIQLDPDRRQTLTRSLARALAALHRPQRAYALLQQARQEQAHMAAQAGDSGLLGMQARHMATQREAEARQLQTEAERTAHELRAQAARQRLLWILVAALLSLSLAGVWLALRLWRRQRRALDLVLRDELTGAPNRRAVQTYAQLQWQQSRLLGTPLTVALLDMDHFKQVNDRWGHAAGDAVLKALAHTGQTVLRGQDKLGRWGGEEWLLVLPGTSRAELPSVFERLRSAFADAPIAGLPTPHGLRFSMGGATQGQETTLGELLARADRALYAAKADGRDRLAQADTA